jgi:hypothetical protein
MQTCIVVALLPFAIIAAVVLLIGDAETEETSNYVSQKLRSNYHHDVTSSHISQSDNDCCRMLSCIPSEVAESKGPPSRKSAVGVPSNLLLCPPETQTGANNTSLVITGGTSQGVLSTAISDTLITSDCNKLPSWSRLA